MASIISVQVLDFLNNDGWNRDGSETSYGPCTANCRPYMDTTNYLPRNNPYKGHYNRRGKKRRYRWAPLLEDNGNGFMFHYDHVVPHIGLTAVTKVLSRSELESQSCLDPKYDYQKEKELVIERLGETAINDTRKMLIEYFDDKTNLVGDLYRWMFGFVHDLNFEDQQVFSLGFQSSEYDGIVQSWLEKRRWDLIRPTTLIKYDKKKIITTYGGPFEGLKDIKSIDFEAYQRVMPHSEYPSGSSCICEADTEFVETFLRERKGIVETTLPIVVEFDAGSSKNEPGMTPEHDLTVQFQNLHDYNHHCGVTRLWGGMHFTDSVHAGQELCKGIGTKGYYLMKRLLEG
eukprot:450019_1